MSGKRKARGRKGPPFDLAAWLWALGRKDEAQALQPFIQFLEGEREPALWASHAEAITREYQRDHPGEKPPIQRRLEKAAAEHEEQQRWREQHGDGR